MLGLEHLLVFNINAEHRPRMFALLYYDPHSAISIWVAILRTHKITCDAHKIESSTVFLSERFPSFLCSPGIIKICEFTNTFHGPLLQDKISKALKGRHYLFLFAPNLSPILLKLSIFFKY
jgi:hypothetical protein